MASKLLAAAQSARSDLAEALKRLDQTLDDPRAGEAEYSAANGDVAAARERLDEANRALFRVTETIVDPETGAVTSNLSGGEFDADQQLLVDEKRLALERQNVDTDELTDAEVDARFADIEAGQIEEAFRARLEAISQKVDGVSFDGDLTSAEAKRLDFLASLDDAGVLEDIAAHAGKDLGTVDRSDAADWAQFRSRDQHGINHLLDERDIDPSTATQADVTRVLDDRADRQSGIDPSAEGGGSGGHGDATQTEFNGPERQAGGEGFDQSPSERDLASSTPSDGDPGDGPLSDDLFDQLTGTSEGASPDAPDVDTGEDPATGDPEPGQPPAGGDEDGPSDGQHDLSPFDFSEAMRQAKEPGVQNSEGFDRAPAEEQDGPTRAEISDEEQDAEDALSADELFDQLTQGEDGSTGPPGGSDGSQDTDDGSASGDDGQSVDADGGDGADGDGDSEGSGQDEADSDQADDTSSEGVELTPDGEGVDSLTEALLEETLDELGVTRRPIGGDIDPAEDGDSPGPDDATGEQPDITDPPDEEPEREADVDADDVGFNQGGVIDPPQDAEDSTEPGPDAGVPEDIGADDVTLELDGAFGDDPGVFTEAQDLVGELGGSEPGFDFEDLL